MSGPSIIRLDRLTKTYDLGEVKVPALRGIDLEIHEGDYVAIAQTGGVAAISTPVDAEIAKLNRELGLTIVLITHEMEVIKQVCHSAALIEHGRIEAEQIGQTITQIRPAGVINQSSIDW